MPNLYADLRNGSETVYIEISGNSFSLFNGNLDEARGMYGAIEVKVGQTPSSLHIVDSYRELKTLKREWLVLHKYVGAEKQMVKACRIVVNSILQGENEDGQLTYLKYLKPRTAAEFGGSKVDELIQQVEELRSHVFRS